MTWYEEFLDQFSPPAITETVKPPTQSNGLTFWLLASVLIIFATR